MSEPLETDRLRLEPITIADVDLLVELDADPEVMRYLTGGTATSREYEIHRAEFQGRCTSG